MKIARNAAVLCLAILVSAPGQAQQAKVDLRLATWLVGCWEMKAGTRIIREVWRAQDGVLSGSAAEIRAGTATESETMILREQNGRLAYEARPTGQAPVVFLSTVVEANRLIFENLQHDYPKRVGYERKGPDTLLAWVEGPIGGRSQPVRFPYSRAKCAP